MICRSMFLAGAISLILSAGAASAQSAGSFLGSSLDGSTISLTVTKVGSVYTVTTMNVGMMAACNKTGQNVSEGWGFLLDDDISSGALNFASHNDYYYTSGGMHFTGPNTIKGTITSLTATFVQGPTPPKNAQFCTVPRQTFTLTKQAPGKALPLQANVDTGRLKPNR